jgi:hypothetical protein
MVRQTQLLDAALMRCAKALHERVELESGSPFRLEIQEQVHALRQAAHFVLNVIDGRNLVLDPIMRPEGALPFEFEGIAMLRELANRLATYDKKNPRRQGRSKPHLAGEPDAHHLCALMVALYWQMRHGEWPGQRNLEADKLCETLWVKAGGDAHPQHRSEPYWRLHLRKAGSFRPPNAVGKWVSQIIRGE